MTHISAGSRIVVTGATGFVGKALTKCLFQAGYEVIGVSRPKIPPADIQPFLVEYHRADLANEWPDIGPYEGLVHLAGLAAVGPSFDNPQTYINENSAMVTHIFEALVRMSWKGRALIVSSGAVYAHGANDTSLLSETSSTAATSPYAISKLLVELQTDYYRRRGVDAIVVRPFNHFGPGQSLGFLVPDLAAKLRASTPNAAIPVGNLASARDYCDVRDIARAYKLLLELPDPRYVTYNVCSGGSVSGWQVLASISQALGVATPPVETVDSRAIDPSVITGDHTRITSETGWSPSIRFETSIHDFLSKTS